MADDDTGEMIGGLLMLVLTVVLVVTVVILAVLALLSLGALFGAGTGLRNYGTAFANNIKPERIAA